ncbi:dna helicase mcm9 isoform x2 [Limosa lapponica baueri]|uniref:Dna helicase mcm9 isoform x2 n=1 Tax=Limosa lapponica baueri TaxID=1758121 RepID=A0A2I0TNP8_LIMLA|nr:dna helicase mcm9 isoform x2 [Limosa lapponica baueri]
MKHFKVQNSRQVQRLSVGSIPRCMVVVLEDDLVDSCKSGRNEILASLCPQVFGLYLVKLAVAMVLAGGVQRTDATGTRIRGITCFEIDYDPSGPCGVLCPLHPVTPSKPNWNCLAEFQKTAT